MYEPAEAYWLTMGDSSVWSDEGGDFLNHGLLKYQDEKQLPLTTLVSRIQGYVSDEK